MDPAYFNLGGDNLVGVVSQSGGSVGAGSETHSYFDLEILADSAAPPPLPTPELPSIVLAAAGLLVIAGVAGVESGCRP